MVTMLSDIASNYVQIRTDQERIKLLTENVQVQTRVYALTKTRLGVGTLAELDVQQAESTLKQTEAAIPLVLIDMRQANDQLCTLLGIPPADLMKMLGNAPIPTTPPEVAIGIPCEMLRRRPDIRRAERVCRRTGRTNRHRRSRSLSHILHRRHDGMVGQNFPDLVYPSSIQRQRRPLV